MYGRLCPLSRLFCSLLPGIKRRALPASLPIVNGHIVVVDVGENVSYKAHHLVQFAQLGVAYQRCIRQIAHPRLTWVSSPKSCSQCHGHLTPRGLFQGIKKAIGLVDQGFIDRIKAQLR